MPLAPLTLVLAIAAGLAVPSPQSAPNPELAGTVRSLGSSTATSLLERIANPFAKLHPGARIDFETGGSSAAIPALIEGRSDLAPMSRRINETERAAFVERFGRPPLEIRIAVDAIGFFVHPDNPLESLSVEQLRRIFGDHPTGDGPATWGDLGVEGPLAARRIVRMISLPSQGSHGIVRSDLLGNGRYHLDCVQAIVATELIQAVTVDPAAIGFVPLVFRTPRAKMLAIDTGDGEPRLPTPEACVAGDYPFARYLYVYLDAPPDRGAMPLAAEFLRFALSRPGQNIVRREGFTPLPPEVAAAEQERLAPPRRR